MYSDYRSHPLKMVTLTVECHPMTTIICNPYPVSISILALHYGQFKQPKKDRALAPKIYKFLLKVMILRSYTFNCI